MNYISNAQIVVYLVGVNVLAFCAFWHDKSASRRSGWRVSEAVLLGFCAIGGSLGGWYACRRLRHKTSKKPFKYRMYLIIFLQICALMYLAYQRYYFDIVWLYIKNFGI